MTNHHDQDATALDPQVFHMAKLLSLHPNARRALEASIERQQQQRAAAAPAPVDMSCPHCTAPGVTYLTLPTANGPREFQRRPMDCCQPALCDAAENALRYACNPNNDPVERVDAADRYAALRESITTPELMERLHMHEVVLATVEQRVSGLNRPQGGVDK